ncbi:MAG: WD40/YVTN/BNR-like repeat-containing protein [Saprospiraceae bacterium]
MNQRVNFLAALFLMLAPALGAQTVNAELLKNLKIRSIGPAGMSGRITAIAVDPVRPEVIYAGAASGGVWRSRGAGTAWEPIFDKAPTQAIGSIAINPHNPDDIWVGTGEGNPRNSQNFGLGIFRSLDGGKNWTCMGLQNTHTIHRVIIHRDNPNIVWAASLGTSYGSNEDRGVFKTEDGGKTWRKTLYVNDLTGCAELVVDPQNPNKLIAAMWEYQRWPWFFKSGGKGSGLYISHDGGDTWERRTDKDGLPEGELGRMGLAISKSNPLTVYAIVEAKENALYKSTDGGKTWRQMATKGQGDRPFYYSEIYVDPTDENTVYSIYTTISRSIDGGKSFEQWAGWVIHPDHHAFWISPDDPNYIINGNDGGLNITRDGGRTWQFADNIPVGQFYHITLDNDWPYNIYGGLQDNGTWVGPSSVWKAGGIRNSDWREIAFGDGFDAFAQADNNRYAYAQSQGGELSLVDVETGDSRYIKPMHPDGKTTLRFNWNSGLAADPFNPKGVFFGSQFLHHSDNGGQNWDIISPDLTTADTSKMHADQSGGLTPDATNAENYGNILAIAPSPAQRGVVWVGTDDGLLQLTTDGGKNWSNLTEKLPGLPKNAWIPHLEVSAKNAGEAFVVANNYRQNDWQPYLYHTTDFGKKWTRLADEKSVKGFCLSVVQDPEVPSLLFLGTDQGLWFSIDYGKTWTRWHLENFPAVPVQDLKIQARDGDLVIGTFGRAIWVMDDLSPLREMARTSGAVLAQPFKIFQPQDGVFAAWRSVDGPRFSANAVYAGENKGTAVRIPVWVEPKAAAAEKEKKKKKAEADGKKDEKKEEPKPAPPAGGGGRRGGGDSKKDKATVLCLSMTGDTLRRFKADVDTCFSYITWGGDTKGARFPSNDEPPKDQIEPGGGPQVLPGEYMVKVIYGEWKDSVRVRFLADPRLDETTAQMQAKADALRDFNRTIERATKAYDRLKEAEKTMKLIDDQFANVPDSLKKAVTDLAKPLRDSISTLKELFFAQKEGKGIQRNPNYLTSHFWRARGYIEEGRGAPNPAAQTAVEIAKSKTESIISRVNTLFDTQWKDYRSKAEAVRYSLFKDFDRL